MLSNNHEEIRRIAINKILKIRKANQMKEADEPTQTSSSDNTFSSLSKKKIRKFHIPHIDFAAKSSFYNHSMINLNDDNTTEPPASSSFEVQDIKAIRENKLILNYPCHNQAVERRVKVVTEVSTLFSTFDQRDGSIRQRI